MEKDVFHTKKRRLTRYALVCGYYERKEKDGRWSSLASEHDMFQVKSGKAGEKFDYWENHESITVARKDYDSR